MSERVWNAEGDAKRTAVRELFSDLAPSYDRVNRAMTLASDRRWRRVVVAGLGLRAGEAALDVCCGTGDFMFPLRSAVGAGGSVVGADFCAPMLAIASRKAVPGRLVLADAAALPLASASFDAATIGWGLRNVADHAGVLAEIARVLRPGGRIASLDMAMPRGPSLRRVSSSALGFAIPRLGAALGGDRDAYAYLPESTQRYATRAELIERFEAAGFEALRTRDFALGNICAHFGVKRS